jgi:nucleotide-binding universal stress UspA family protein
MVRSADGRRISATADLGCGQLRSSAKTWWPRSFCGFAAASFSVTTDCGKDAQSNDFGVSEGGDMQTIVVHMLAGKGGMGYDPIEKEGLERELVAAKARLGKADIAVMAVEGMGDPARVISEEAKQAGADLIVVGNGHKNLIERLLLGSVSDGLTHHTDCDVLIVG